MRDNRQKIKQQIVWTAITLGIVLLLLLCIFSVVGCSSDDEEEMPPYNTVLAEVMTDNAGRAVKLRFDDGQERTITNEMTNLTPDSLYRVVSRIIDNAADHTVTIYGLKSVLAPMPKDYEPGKQYRDAVDVITTWRTPRYINLRLGVHRSEEKIHYLGFKDNGYISYESGKRTKVYELMHGQNGDGDSYVEEVIASCPVYQLADELREGQDSVRMVITTYGKKVEYTTLY